MIHYLQSSSLSLTDSSPLEVTTLYSTPPYLRPADGPSNYLSLKSIATPRDRGTSIVIGPQVEPIADLREAEGEVNREGHHGEWEHMLRCQVEYVNITSRRCNIRCLYFFIDLAHPHAVSALVDLKALHKDFCHHVLVLQGHALKHLSVSGVALWDAPAGLHVAEVFFGGFHGFYLVKVLFSDGSAAHFRLGFLFDVLPAHFFETALVGLKAGVSHPCKHLFSDLVCKGAPFAKAGAWKHDAAAAGAA